MGLYLTIRERAIIEIIVYIQQGKERVKEMKVVVLQAGKEDGALKGILVKIKDVLEELQVEVKLIDLSMLPYYDGKNAHVVEDILKDIEMASGVVAISRVELLAVSGSLASFFEHCTAYKGNPLFQKPLLALTASDWRGEREVAEYMLHAWDILGGAEFGKLAIYTPRYNNDKENILVNAERMAEDFYRVMRQAREPIRSSDYTSFVENNNLEFENILEKSMTEQSEGNLEVKDKKSKEEKDIEDLANFFKNQLLEEESQELFIPAPMLKTAKNPISNLPHYFQGQHAVDFRAIIQYHTLTDEPFSGYLTIENGDCIFQEGIHPEPQIELTAEIEMFWEIFTKEITAQKAFMLGRLKVRGNFMILPRLDQMFKKM